MSKVLIAVLFLVCANPAFSAMSDRLGQVDLGESSLVTQLYGGLQSSDVAIESSYTDLLTGVETSGLLAYLPESLNANKSLQFVISPAPADVPAPSNLGVFAVAFVLTALLKKKSQRGKGSLK